MTTTPQQQTIDTFAWLRLLNERQFAELCRQIIAVVNWYGERTQASLDVPGRQQLNDLMNLILFLLAHPAFQVPDDLAAPFVGLNRTLSNMAAISCFRTTDACLQIVKQQPNNFIRLLTLYSARNRVRLDAQLAFQANPFLASLWYAQFAQGFHAGLPSETVHAHLAEHFAAAPEQLVPVAGMQDIFFGSTYANPTSDRIAKARVNAAIQRQAARVSVDNRPNPRKIGILSAHWHSRHSVYRTFHDFVRALKPAYHLTFLNLGNHTPAEASLFDEIRIIPSSNGVPNPSSLLHNDFQLLYFPDIGMSDESVFLANLRMAPIQVTTIGHSVSTFGAAIDYFISGSDVEPADAPEQNYSERLVLLPGMGCTHKTPDYPRPATAGEPTSDTILINCAWAGHKINFPFLKSIAHLLSRCRRRIKLQIFESGATLFRNDYIPFTDSLSALLPPGTFEVIPNQPYQRYMQHLQRGHLALDSFHFGGCNTVSDSLWLGIPILCREGDRWYNRIGPHMLRLAGLAELGTASETQFLETADRLIHDDAFRRSLRQRIQQAPLAQTIYNPADASCFKQAVDLLIAQHAHLQREGSRAPIRISRT